MISLRQSQTLFLNFSPPPSPSSPKPPKNRVFLAHLGTSSSSPTDSVPKRLDLDWAGRVPPPYSKITPPTNRGINFVAPSRAFIVERDGKYLKTLRTGIHLLNPMVDRITDVHSLKEQLVDIPVETIIIDGLEIMLVGGLFIKVVNPFLASYANNGDPISAVTQLIEASFPLGSMIEEMVFNPIFDEFKASYNLRSHYKESLGIQNFENFEICKRFTNEFFTNVDFENDDHINKITTASWGVECLRLRMDICFPKMSEIGVLELSMLLLDAFLSYRISKNQQKLKRSYELVMRHVDYDLIKITELVREYYERRGRGRGRNGANGTTS